MKKALAVVGILLGLGAAGAVGAWYWYQAKLTRFAAQPYGTPEPRTLEVPQGTGPKALAQLLASAGLVSDADLLYGYLRRERLGPKLRAGEYEFAGPITPRQVIDRIISGQVKVYRFTVPEGLRADEILPIVAASELKLSLEKLQQLAGDTAFLRQLGVPADRVEGFLFPDTYSFPRGATEKSVLTKMITRTLGEYRAAEAARKPGVRLDLLQAVTLASIVEKETGAPEERPRISCVFHNRLRLNMKLQTDPTVIYAMMLLRGQYSKNIRADDLKTPHPYNTYTTKGLPPGPIASPGSAALRAALHPLECDDLFFVSRNDGSHVFCPDLKCHEAEVDRWQKQFFRNKRTKTASQRGSRR